MPIPFHHKVITACLAACLLAGFLPLPFVHADTNIIVNTTLGNENTTDGSCSFREAVKAAIYNTAVDSCPAGTLGTDTITFAQSGTIAMNTVLSDGIARGPIVIDGAGWTVTVTGTSTMSYLLRVPQSETLTLRNLTLSGARTGISVEDNGTLHTENVNFQNFKYYEATKGNIGQGIGVGTATLTVSGGVFSNNDYGINIIGGTASVSGATFTGNITRGLGNGTAMLTVSNCVFQENPGGGLKSGSNLTAIDSVFTANATSANGAGVLTTGAATLTRCTFTGNTTSGFGGAVYVSASSTLTGCTFQDNQAGKNGGAVYSSGLELTLNGNAFIGNQATSATAGEGLGGALYMTSSWLRLANSTFSGNSAQNGAAVYSTNANLNLTNNTFTDHTNLASGSGSLAVAAGKTIVMSNNLVANTRSGANCSPGITIATNLNNLSTDDSCGSATQVAAADLLLGDLLTYNNTPAVIPLLPGSAAIDAGDNNACAANPVANFDQRGLSRPVGDACDVGAFESRGYSLAKAGGDDQTATIELPFPAPLKVSVASLADPPEPVDGGRITFLSPASGASATLTGSPATISAGEASVSAAANATTGQYTVSATAAGAEPVGFTLHNVEEPAQPGPILTVTTLQEHSVGVCGAEDCTLREAMLAANQSPADTTIHFAVSGTLTLSAPLPAVLPSGGALTIDGTGQAVTIDGAGQHRIFEVNYATFSLNLLTLTNGQVSHPENDLGDGGAGVYNKGGLVSIENCTLSNFQAGANTNGGGAVFNGYAGALSVANSLFSGSSAAGDGGAILNLGQGAVVAINSTFTGNSAAGRGGALAILADEPEAATLQLTHATLAGNSAAQGGGIYTNMGRMRLASTIFSENTGGNCGEQSPGWITDEAGNLTSDGTCPGLNAAARLGPLADNGGPTGSMALLPGSPALELAPSASCPPSDQTGAARPNPAGTLCDAGATESALRPPPRLQLSFNPDKVVIGQAATLTYRVANPNDGGGLSGLQFTDTLPDALRIAASPKPVNTCGGTLTASAGGKTVTLSAGSVAGGASCEVSVDVVASTLGVITHSAAAVSSVETGAGSVSAPASLTVERWAASLNITAHTPDPSVIGGTVTVSVTALGGVYSSGTPSGQVTVSDDLSECNITLANGAGSCALLLATAGSRTLSASYAGDEHFLGCASPQVTHTVNKAGAIVSIVGRSPTSSVSGQSVTVTVNVASAVTGAGVPAGQVTVNGGGQSCTASLSEGTGSCALNLPHAGQIELSAAYAGNDTFAAGVSPGVEHRVYPAATAVSLNVDAAAPRYGQAVTLTASVSAQAPGGGTPTGTVTFADGATVLGTANLQAGAASLSAPALAPGEHNLTATYNTDGDFLTSQGALAAALTVLPAETALALNPSSEAPVFGQVIELTAAISPIAPGGGVPQGTVTFTANGQPIPGCAAVATSQAEAACAYTAAEVGALTLSAAFTGSAAYEGSTDQLDLVVGKALTALSVYRVGAGPRVHGQPVQVAFTLTVQAPGAGQPSGQVSLQLGDAACTVDLAEGGCWLAPSAGGVLSLSGAYSGDEHFAASSAPGIGLHLDEIFPIFLPLLIH